MSKPRSYHYSGTMGHIKDVASSFPKNYVKLLDKGWIKISHPKSEENGHFKFVEKNTHLTIMFDKGVDGKPGWTGRDHYHIFNPKPTGRGDMYLDKDGNPVAKGSSKSHIEPNN